MGRIRLAIGLMSGTSLDGVDAAVLRTDGEGLVEPGPGLTLPYPHSLRERLRALLGSGGGDIAAAEQDMTLFHAAAVRALLSETDYDIEQIDVVGFHGQTLLHQPEQRLTWQIGDGQLLANQLGVTVVNDFRSADVSVGGQGAPLVPAYHRALSEGMERPLAVLNIGGVANVTWIGADNSLMAFDTGPGNALIDDWILKHTGQPYDAGGKIAAAGTVHQNRVGLLLAHSYFSRPAPKSLDRDEFAREALQLCQGLSVEDGAATLTACTAWAVRSATAWLPAPPRRWLVCGGGRLNPFLLKSLRRILCAPVENADHVGWDGDQMEAQAFAYLAVRSLDGLPISFPSTTGAPRPMPGGRTHHPEWKNLQQMDRL